MDEGLALPDFPPIEHFQFELPSVSLIRHHPQTTFLALFHTNSFRHCSQQHATHPAHTEHHIRCIFFQVPLIPRLLPNTERLLGLGGGGAPSSRHAPGDTTFSVSNAAGSGAHLYSAGAGASGAALAIVAIAGLRSLRRRAGRLERRAASK